MTDQEINRAIAETCGWHFDPSCGPLNCGWWSPERQAFPAVPDYCNDLNAIAEAWQINPPAPFTDSFNYRHELAFQLSLIVARDYDKDPFWKDSPLFKELLNTGCDYWIANATSRQRAEAFLRTLSLWKD